MNSIAILLTSAIISDIFVVKLLDLAILKSGNENIFLSF